ncbi:MAG: relaxase/mobilization nuclease domain-containing protein [Lachnospiraceae bacterium]
MAITKILTLKDCGCGYSGKHLKRSIDYIMADAKTDAGHFVAGVNCQPEYAYEQMYQTKQKFGKTDKRQGYHLIISFAEEEVDPETAFEIIGNFVERYLGTEYEAVYAVHDNTAHVHGHIIFNSVNCITGKKYRYEKGDWAKSMQPLTNRLCEEYGLSTITIESGRKMSNEHYKDWNDFRDGKYVWADMIKRDIDACILQAYDYDNFISLMEQRGYEVKQNKYVAVKPPGMTQFRRLKSFGDDYCEEAIRNRIVTETLKDYQLRSQRPVQPRIVRVKYVKRYKRPKLTKLQKKYFAKLYRTGRLKKRPYSQAWKYWDEIKKMHYYHSQYMFLSRYQVSSVQDLTEKCNRLEEERKQISKERSKCYKERAKFNHLFKIAEDMEKLLPAENSFQNGDNFFMEEHASYEALKAQLAKEGYTYEEVLNLKEHYRSKAAKIRDQGKAVAKDLSVGKGIMAELEKETEERLRNMQQTKCKEEQVNKEVEVKQPKR